MAKKKRGKQHARKQPRRTAPPATHAPKHAPSHAKPLPPSTSFWFGFEISSAKLAVARVVVFGLLALDAVLQVRHAPRYGASDFNVAQLPWLDALGPGRVAYTICQLAIAYLLVVAAFGLATRIALPIATALYAWLYFGSQLDSYQHHYLVALVLLLACFVPWQPPPEAAPATPVRSWALRLVLVQLAIVYLWAAISKLDRAWLDGRTLASQLTGTVGKLIGSTVGFKVAAISIIVVELALAATIWSKRTWRVAAPLGIALHLGIIATGLEIGLFAYLMLGLYVLVIPDRIWLWIADRMPSPRAWLDRTSWRLVGACLVVSIVVAWLVRLPFALPVALVALVVPLELANRARRRRSAPRAAIGIAHLAAILLWLVVDRTTSVAADYYKYWGGSQRRLAAGNPARKLAHEDEAERAYRRWVAIAPGDAAAHFQLGRLLIQRGRGDDGIGELHQAQSLDPHGARAFAEEARALAAQGRMPEAVAKAKDAVFAEPSNQDARALLDQLSKSQVPASPAPDDPD
ncbi:MAG TPA: HTTM domain-containing protein [Kofleriaceae bacterium]|nr:HTTM domain-containing protein [Kofleriaceae bacterium]